VALPRRRGGGAPPPYQRTGSIAPNQSQSSQFGRQQLRNWAPMGRSGQKGANPHLQVAAGSKKKNFLLIVRSARKLEMRFPRSLDILFSCQPDGLP